MNSICKYFPFVALAARYRDDLKIGNDDKHDYIRETLKSWFPGLCDDAIKYHYPKYRYDIAGPGKLSADGFALTIDLPEELLIVCLGTDGSDEWVADTLGYTDDWVGLMHSGYGNAAESTFRIVSKMADDQSEIGKAKDWMKRKPIIIIGQSQGGPEACGVALLIAETYTTRAHTFAYNPPPGFTEEGVFQYVFNGLDETTTNIFAARNDIVGIAGELKYEHVGSSIILPDADEFMQKIPVVGGHSYRSTIASLIEYARSINDQEAIDWLEKTRGVAKI